jgi:glucokinase
VILAGDIGGTKTVLALFDEGEGPLNAVREETYPSKSAASLEELGEKFLGAAGQPSLRAACFGVAGAVVAGRAKATNLPWVIDEATLSSALRVPRVRLLNDLEAAGYGVLAVPPQSIETLQAGSPPAGGATMALIAAGTGLGEAILPWDGHAHRVMASEGGHSSFAPQNEVEAALWEFLWSEVGHVSYERVLSGPGFMNVYRFLRRYRKHVEPDWLSAEMKAGDPSAAVSRAALAGTDPVCVETMSMFVSMYGAEAGNLALKALAVGGVYVGGGIAPKILTGIKSGGFLAAFADKGRMAPLLRSIPVHVVLDPRAPLLGAAACARTLT